MPLHPTLFAAKSINVLRRSPAISFFILLALLFGVISLATFFRTPVAEPQREEPETKATQVFTVGLEQPTLSVQAEVTKESVLNIVSLVPGIVTNVRVSPGRTVSANTTLFTITNDYQSGAASLERQILTNSNQFIVDTYALDKRINELERRLVKRDDTYSDLKENIELKKLKEEQKRISLNKDNARLSIALAMKNEAALNPKTFVAGIVERVYVRYGDYVAPGTVLATLRTSATHATLETLVSRETATLFNPSEPATIRVGTSTVSLLPTSFSLQETSDGLYSIIYSLNPEIARQLTDGSYIALSLPLSPLDPDHALLPIDGIFQDTTGATVLVRDQDRAIVRQVTLGNIYGGFVEIRDDFAPGTEIILNRGVIAGDKVSILEK